MKNHYSTFTEKALTKSDVQETWQVTGAKIRTSNKEKV
jgi:hypothetical protein